MADKITMKWKRGTLSFQDNSLVFLYEDDGKAVEVRLPKMDNSPISAMLTPRVYRAPKRQLDVVLGVDETTIQGELRPVVKSVSDETFLELNITQEERLQALKHVGATALAQDEMYSSKQVLRANVNARQAARNAGS